MRLLSFLISLMIVANTLLVVPAAEAAVSSERRELIKVQRQIQRELRKARRNKSRFAELKQELSEIRAALKELKQSKSSGDAVESSSRSRLSTQPVRVNRRSFRERRQRVIASRQRRQLNPVKLKVNEPVSAPDPVPAAELFETGIASYYADMFNGRTTASGTIFSNNDMTAAHKTLPFGTKVRVINPENGNFVDVVITDRGPFTPGRVIDLTSYAFQQLTPLSRGLVDVQVHILEAVE